MRFIDLFAGLGGFHLALDRLGCRCVFASEIDAGLADLYEKNFDVRPAGDIRRVLISEVPEHEILCAGSPCQPFSKAGTQHGLDCPRWGDLLDHVLRIVRARKPQYLILENVPHLKRHNEGETWRDLEIEFVRDRGARRVWVRGHENVRKRVLIQAAGCNLGLLLRRLTGVGTPRSLQGRALSAICGLIGRLTGLWGRLTASWDFQWTPAGGGLYHVFCISLASPVRSPSDPRATIHCRQPQRFGPFHLARAASDQRPLGQVSLG